MNPTDPGKQIVLKSPDRLTHSAGRTLISRGLADLESSESADQWLAKAEEHFSKDANKLIAMGKSVGKWSMRKLTAWNKSDEHRANISAYFDCLQRAAAAKPNYPRTLMELAKAHLNGWGVRENRGEALRLLRSAAAFACPDELWEMSWTIKHDIAGGDPWPEGMCEAKKMCRKGADLGHAGAQYSLGEMYVKGEGGLQCDDELALFWFKKAAENGEFPPAEGQLQYWKSKKGEK
jgi:TPR repeat protein